MTEGPRAQLLKPSSDAAALKKKLAATEAKLQKGRKDAGAAERKQVRSPADRCPAVPTSRANREQAFRAQGGDQTSARSSERGGGTGPDATISGGVFSAAAAIATGGPCR